MPLTDWPLWHQSYDDPSSPLSRRLRIVQGQLATWLDSLEPARRVRVLSLCSGDGRDLLEVLAGRTDAGRVDAVLVEKNAQLCTRARAFAATAGLSHVDVRCADAGRPGQYADCAGADLVLLTGVFGNISDADVRQTVGSLPMLCAQNGQVIWTRHRNEPDLTPSIRRWLEEAGFVERAFIAPPDVVFSVGVHEHLSGTKPWSPPDRLFEFLR